MAKFKDSEEPKSAGYPPDEIKPQKRYPNIDG